MLRPEEPQVHATPGFPELRAPSRPRPRRDSGYEVEAGQVVVTNGGKHAVYNAFQALLDPGDEVLVPAPYWTTYPEAVSSPTACRSRCSPPSRPGSG